MARQIHDRIRRRKRKKRRDHRRTVNLRIDFLDAMAKVGAKLRRLGRQIAAFHATYDVLLTPALATLPPKLGWIDMTMDDVHEYWRRVFHFSPFTVCFNLTGQPAIVLPLGRCDATPERTATGFPIAVQLVARYGGEATLCRLAAQLEKARRWFDRKPLVASDSNSESARSAAR